MEVWKWNLAFQCVVNIGVRGSETVRTRVVEADMVPVIATILDNYVRVVDRLRERSEAEAKRSRLGSSRHYSRTNDASSGQRSERSRRQAPPPIEIPQPFNQQSREPGRGDSTPTLPAYSLSSPPERTTFARPHIHHHNHSQEGSTLQNLRPTGQIGQPLGTAVPVIQTHDTFGIRPVRDIDRLPSMLPNLHAEITSQPDSPTTPSGPIRPESPSSMANGRSRRRPSIRHQLSLSGTIDDVVRGEDIITDEGSADPTSEPIVGIQNEINMQDMVAGDDMLVDGSTPVPIAAPGEEEAAETFNITHRGLNGSIITPIPPAAPIGFPPMQPALNVVPPTPPTLPTTWNARFTLDRIGASVYGPTLPRDEDVLMSLQLLAYVSKYCNLRSYFQKSHLVPRLKLPDDLSFLDGDSQMNPIAIDDDDDEEYLLPDDFNIFPLVEKFTVRHYTQEMQYWAGVVMRNLCRKDDSRGGVRQCAYYQCGKWEAYPRQFAKCRRCRRTKYCSKDCQKSAWVYHRHWCVAAQT